MRRWRNSGWWVLFWLLAALAGLGLYALGHWPHPAAPREALCPQGEVLQRAQLLERARTVYSKAASEGNECRRAAPGARAPLAAVEARLAGSERAFAAARALAAAEQPAQALPHYLSGLLANPFDEAGKLGLGRALAESGELKGKFCAYGRELTAGGLLAEAQAALSRGIEEEQPACKMALAELGRQSARANASFQAASRRADEGEAEAARDGYAGALLLDAELGDARTALEGSIDEESRIDAVGSWLDGVPGTLKNALGWLVPLAIGLLVAAIALWILIRELAARIFWVRRLCEWLARRCKLGFLHAAATPRFSIEDLEGGGDGDAAGKDFTNLLSAELGRQVGRKPPFLFDRTSKGSKEDTGFRATAGKALAEVPETKLLGNLLTLLGQLFRRRSIVVSGRLIAVTDQGAGVLLAVEGSGRDTNHKETLWEKGFDPAPGGDASSRWLRLVPAAAVWVRWRLADACALRPVKSADWLPDALFQSGLAWEDKRDWGRAEALYTAVLEANPDMLPAAHNLAVIEMRSGAHERARQRLEGLRARLHEMREEGARSGDPEATELWPTLGPSSQYSLILAIAYPEIEKPMAGPSDALAEAIEQAERLVGKTARLIERESKLLREEREPKHLTAEEIGEMTVAEPSTVVVLASLAVRQRPEARHAATREALEPDPNARALTRADLATRLDTLGPAQLIHGYVERQNVSRRTRYNLACYYTTLGEYADGETQSRLYDRARESLEAAMGWGALREWAEKDPSLRELKAADPGKFEKARGAHPIAAHPSGDKPADGAKPAASGDDGDASPVDLIRRLLNL